MITKPLNWHLPLASKVKLEERKHCIKNVGLWGANDTKMHYSKDTLPLGLWCPKSPQTEVETLHMMQLVTRHSALVKGHLPREEGCASSKHQEDEVSNIIWNNYVEQQYGALMFAC